VAARYAYVTLIIVASIHEDPHSLARRPIFITIACSLRFFVAQGAERGRGEALSPRQRLLAELFLLFLYRYLSLSLSYYCDHLSLEGFIDLAS